jgi:hypothetical protein
MHSLLRVADRTEENSLGIFTYVAAQSYLRMLQNFQPGSVSKPFIDRLLEVAPSRARLIKRPFPSPQRINNPLGQRDIAFIDFLVQPITEHFVQLSHLNIHNLMRVAKEYRDAPPPGPNLPALYTEDTCEEFHHLLCHLLRRFEATLLKLHEFQYRSPADRCTEDFEMAVYGVATCGLTLRSLVHSSFLEEHLVRIQAPNPYPQACVGNAGINVMDLNMHMSPEALEFYPHGTCGNDSGSHSVCTAYAHCLHSQVAHFEAANHLVGFASRFREAKISIKAVTAVEDCEGAMHPWRQVIKEIVSSSPLGKSRNHHSEEVITAIEGILSESASLASRLDDSNPLGTNFRGTIHCGAWLASVLVSPSVSQVFILLMYLDVAL